MTASARLLIIQPAHFKNRSNLELHKTRKRKLIGVTLPYLAALTPPDWACRLIDEQLTDIDFDTPVDLVAITAWTINSIRAYQIADRFRERGIPVILGGPHTCFYTEEAAKHCDAVGIGEGEHIWPRMIEDAARGKLKPVYHAVEPEDLRDLPFPRYNLMDLGKYGLIRTFALQTSRGCPFNCEFCSERFYLGRSYRYRPVRDVVDEVKKTGARYFMFADSNFAGKRSHAMELMEALIPLKIRWSTLWSAYLCKNREFMDLARRSGLLHVNIGIETIEGATLAAMNKKINKVNEYEEIFRNLRERGISYSVNLQFGWDTESPEVFSSTLAFLREQKVPVAYFNILTPHRGTTFYDRMKAEGRVIDDDNIGRWPGLHCYIKPAYCSPEELEKQVMDIFKGFYGVSSMLTRLSLPLTKSSIASWMVNLSQWRVSRSSTAMEDFDSY
jgi:radical SAM superfamily enzyme YgiQ (UPF0313 family)